MVQHGAALGIGIAAMATEDDELYEELKGVLFNDSAVAGEAAAIAMGLIMLGSGSGKAIEEMLGYAHDTQHEKIIRGLALALGMTMYAREEEAEALITTLLLDKDADPALRRHVHDRLRLRVHRLERRAPRPPPRRRLRRVRRRAPRRRHRDRLRAGGDAGAVPKVVKLLAESYNPHVRYGATMAVGISCAGTGLREALDLLSRCSPTRSTTCARARSSACRWC